MERDILNPKRAQEIQDKILFNMPSDKSIKLASRISLLTIKLSKSKAVSKNVSRRTFSENK